MPAPPVIPLVATLMAKAAGFGILAQMFTYTASSLLVSELMEDSQPDEFTPPRGIEIQRNICSTGVSLPLVYGEVKIGGNDVFMWTTGVKNKYLWIVQTLAEGECEGIKAVDGGVVIDDLTLIEHESQYGSGLIDYTFHNGSATQTYDTDLHDAVIAWIDNMRRTCYIVWKFTYDPEAFHSIPKRTVILEARKIWLPNDTQAYSNNAAAVLYDFLRSPHCALGLGWPGENMMLTDEVDYYSYLAAYNYCETKGWTFNGAVFHSEMARDVINRIRKHFRGSLRWSDGMFRFKYRDLNDESVAMALTDDHIARDANGKAMIGISEPGQINVPDGLCVSFINTTGNKYIEDYVRIGETENSVFRDIDLTGYNSRELAGKMGSYILERNRNPYDRVISGMFRDDCQQLERDDPVTLTCTALGYSAQYMRVVDVKRQASGLVRLEMQLEHTDLYNDVYDVETETEYTCTLPDKNNFDPITSAERYVEPEFESDGTLTLEVSDLNKVYVIDSNDDLTIYMPSVDTDQLASKIKFKHYGTGKLTLQAADSDTIDNSSAGGSIYHQQSGISQEGSITLQLVKSTHWAVNDILGPWFTDAADELFLHSALYINDKTFGNQGVQIEYNAGAPRAYIGDGAYKYLQFDGTKPMWKSTNTELDASGNLTCTGGIIGGWTINATTQACTNITLDAGNDKITVNTITIDGANDRIRSSNYVAGPNGAGFTVEPDLIEAGNLAARGILRMAVFQKDVISAIGGNVIVSKGSDVLAEDMTANDDSTLIIEGNETFEVGDMLRIKDDTDDEWMEVTDVSSDLTTYTVTRDKNGDYGADSNPAWKKGATVVNYGVSGDGLIHITASETNAPYLNVMTHAGAPWDTLTERLRIGNLNGYLGYSSDIYGIGIGDTDSYIKCDPTNGITMQVTAADAITVKAGGDIKLEADESDPGVIKFVGTSYTTELGDYTASGTLIGFKPLTDDEIILSLGLTTNRFTYIYLYSSLGYRIYDYVDVDNYTLIHSQTQIGATTHLITCRAEGDSKTALFHYESDSSGEDCVFYPNEDNTWDLGRHSQKWKDFYAVTATLSNTGLHLLDTDSSHDLIIAPGSDITADRTLTLTTGDANRTLIINGNATLNDWFDQSVKTTASPIFAELTVTGAITSGGDAIAKLKTESYTGDGTTNNAVTDIGFLPKFLIIWGKTTDGLDTPFFFTSTQMMARDAQGLCFARWGAYHASFNNRIISLDSDGFSVSDGGANYHPNSDGIGYEYVAFG